MSFPYSSATLFLFICCYYWNFLVCEELFFSYCFQDFSLYLWLSMFWIKMGQGVDHLVFTPWHSLNLDVFINAFHQISGPIFKYFSIPFSSPFGTFHWRWSLNGVPHYSEVLSFISPLVFFSLFFRLHSLYWFTLKVAGCFVLFFCYHKSLVKLHSGFFFPFWLLYFSTSIFFNNVSLLSFSSWWNIVIIPSFTS